MIVADASVVVAALLREGESRSALARELVHAPHLVDSEVAHSLRRHAAAGLVTPERAWGALARWRHVGIVRHGSLVVLGRVWELRHDLSAYDATYVALAEWLGCALVTGDRRLGRAPGVRCPITVVPD